MKKILTTPIKAEDLADIRIGDAIYAASGNSADCLMRRSRVLSGRLSSV